MHSALATKAAGESIGPLACNERRPQNDNAKNSSVSSVPSVVKDVDVFRELVKAGHRFAEIHVH
jgi:hypothetical protein